MPEEYKIDYTGIQVPDIESIKRTSQQFTDWRKSMGFQTEEEKNAALKAEMQAAQQRFNDRDLWNSEDPYEVYNAYETDPAKQAEFQRNGQMVAGVGSTIATLPFTAGMIGGWTPAIVSTATGAAGGYVGAYGGQKLGQYIDDKYGTNTTPWLTTIGGIGGGILGGGAGYKGWEGAVNQHIINKAFKSGQLKWGQPTSYTAYHQSSTPITKFKFPFKRWDVAKHGADPNGAFFTVGKPAGSGFLAERPYTGQFQVKVQKPLIQTGELTGPTKNGLRNAIVRRARKNGADAVFFDGIADNTLQNQQILFAMDNADISFTGGPGKVRYFGPTMGKTTLIKTNNNYVDLDQLVKPLRKQIAEQLGLKVSDPRVAKSTEYQTALKQIVEEFQTNTANAGKTLVGSQKQLLNGDFVLDGEPMLPDFETFVARNQARGFKETPEQLRIWYDEILGLKPDIKVDNRYVSEIVYGKPSKLTEAERLGIPKGERNQPLNGHLKGDDAVQMFKEYGIVDFPENSSIKSQIEKLVSEARERYGLVGRTDITDEEIAGSLYKRALELNGEGNAVVWTETGEPRLLFRGDTRRYNRLMDKPEPEYLVIGTEDNSLGNLFLGELPGGSEWGIERYLHRVEPHPFFGGDALWLSATGSGIKHGKTVLREVPTNLVGAYGQIYGPKTTRAFGKVRLLPASLSAGGGNDVNPFVIRAKSIRDATGEISVGADVALLKSKGIDYSSGTRGAMLKHYRTVLDDATSKNQGLLVSNPNSPFRPDEHTLNTYYALPNFNRQNAKHLFGWDLRRPVQWNVDNIYLEKGGKIENPDH